MIAAAQLIGGLVLAFAILPLLSGRIAVAAYRLIRRLCGSA